MEYRKLREESEQCVRFERIEAIVKHYNREFGFVVFAGNMVYEIGKLLLLEKVISLGKIRVVKTKVAQEAIVDLWSWASSGIVVKMKSVYITNKLDVYESLNIYDVDNLLGVGIGWKVKLNKLI